MSLAPDAAPISTEPVAESTNQAPTREDYLRGIEGILTMLRANPDVPLPTGWDGSGRVTVWASSKEAVAGVVRAMGGGEKSYGTSYFAVARGYGPVRFQVLTERATVCRRVVTGYKDIPASEGYRQEIVEWECEGSVLGWDQVLA